MSSKLSRRLEVVEQLGEEVVGRLRGVDVRLATGAGGGSMQPR
ncbi:MAG: hypothetical protein R2690_09430 [Acidimicrobiales bacterium]